MKKLLLPFLIPTVGFAAVKGYYWYQVKSAADQFAQQLGPFATVEYDGIVAGFDGVAGVTGLRITPFGNSTPLQVDAFTVNAPNWTYFLRSRDQGELPDQLGVSLSGLSVDLSGDFFKQMVLADAPRDPLLGCPGAPAGVELLKVLGYQHLSADLEMDYRFNPQSEFMTLQISASVADDFDFQVTGDLDLGGNQLTGAALSGGTVRLGGLELVYRDRSFNERRNRYCAGRNGEDVVTFLKRHVALLADHYRARGFEFSEVLETAYGDFVKGDGELKLSMRAEEPLGAAALATYSPGDLLGAMEIEVAINGQIVEPLALSWALPGEPVEVAVIADADADADQQAVLGLAEEVPGVSVEQQEAQTEEISVQDVQPTPTERFEATAFQKPASSVQSKFQSVAVQALEDHAGRRLRILTRNGREIEGTLLSLSRSGLRLHQQIGRGEAILPIAFNRITSIEAFY